MQKRGELFLIITIFIIVYCSYEILAKSSSHIEEPIYNKAKNKRLGKQPLIYEHSEDSSLELANTKTVPTGKKEEKDLSFTKGFIESLALIFISEFGDRTFMLTVLYSMKYSTWSVMIPGCLTMMTMHVISVAFGSLFPMILSPIIIKYVSVALFFFFGVKMLYEGYYLGKETDPDRDKLMSDINTSHSVILEAEIEGRVLFRPRCPICEYVGMLFMADWGDRCQISAVVLTTTRNIFGVAAGGAIGMAICVILAVFGGGYIAGKISEQTTTYIGAVLFFFFAIETLIFVQQQILFWLTYSVAAAKFYFQLLSFAKMMTALVKSKRKKQII